MQSSNCNFTVQRDNATHFSLWRGFLHHDMTPTLTRLNEAKPF